MKKAASLIELVVAIVIMGIAVMTLPMMLNQTQKNNEFTLHQEVLLAARTKLGDILTYRWDENSLVNDRIVVLEVTNGDSELDIESGIRRKGHINANKRRKFSLGSNASTTLGPDGNLSDIDDFDGESIGLTLTKADLDYRFTDLNMATTVNYVSDIADYNNTNLSFTFETNSSSPSTNLKMITLETTAVNTTFILRAYSANIGESELLRRSY